MSKMMYVHHAISEGGLYIPFETPTKNAATKKDSPPVSQFPPQCADKNLERDVAQFLAGTLTYNQLRWNMAADRMRSSHDPEAICFPSKSEVRNEYARIHTHARTCVACLMKYGGEISPNHIKLLGILQLPTAIN